MYSRSSCPRNLRRCLLTKPCLLTSHHRGPGAEGREQVGHATGICDPAALRAQQLGLVPVVLFCCHQDLVHLRAAGRGGGQLMV